MKSLLLAPLLLGLLISNSALAGRPNPKTKLIKQQQQEYISTCNNSEKGFWIICNKILKINRDRITNKRFIASKKDEAKKELEECFRYRFDRKLFDGYNYASDYGPSANIDFGAKCEEIVRGNFNRVDWITEDLTISDKAKIRVIAKHYLKALKNYKQPKVEVQSKDEIRLDFIRFCESLLKENLKDPSSYERINSRDNQISTGFIRYSATNSFGGRVQEVFQCFDPLGSF